jgi:hypothetical protein
MSSVAPDPFTKTFTAQIELAVTRSNADYEYVHPSPR